jgi:multiple sugar transport system permease protein
MTVMASDAIVLARPRRWQALAEPWAYLSPALVIIVTVLLVPLIIGISYSFWKFSAFRSEYAGLDQYRTLAADPVLYAALVNTAWWTIGSLFFQFFLGLGLALILNRPFMAANSSRRWSSCPGRCRRSSPASPGPGFSIR